MKNIRLTPSQLLELAQGEPVLRWDVEDTPRVQFDGDLKTKQEAIMNQSMSKRFFNLTIGTSDNKIDITMVVTWDCDAHVFIKRGLVPEIVSTINVESAYNFIITYLHEYGDPEYVNKIINN